MFEPIRWPGLTALTLSGLLAMAAAPARPQEPANPPPPEGQFCGGIAAFQCPEGYSCVDDPGDDCDPNSGGADCGGICIAGEQPAQPPKCDPRDPNLQYVSRDPQQCAAIRFTCPEGFEPFFNDCGCGCQPIAP